VGAQSQAQLTPASHQLLEFLRLLRGTQNAEQSIELVQQLKELFLMQGKLANR
jgi:hypothetical protein